MEKDKWFSEEHAGILKISFKHKEKLFDENSSFQNVKIIDTEGFGKMLINDSIVMTCERDEFVYHEMISHVPLFTHPNPKDVLIIGGGDGGTAREVLKHKNINSCEMVEIDSVVVSACKKHLQATACSFDHPKLNLQIADGADFIAKRKEAFDVIIVDSSDPIGPSSVLFGEAFYKNVHSALRDQGIAAAQGGSLFYELENQKNTLKFSKGLFKKAGFYRYSNLSYPPGSWSFLFASKGPCPLKDFNPEKVKASGISFRYYNADIHKAAFAMPEFAKKAFSGLWTI